jgi:hypothetical protein
MDDGKYQRIPELRSPVAQDVKESLTIYKMKQLIDAERLAKTRK